MGPMLRGVNSPFLDAVPSMDTAGHFYFTTLRQYARTMNSIYTGTFTGKQVINVHPAPGQISPETPRTVNMDAGISPDGQALYILIFCIILAPSGSMLKPPFFHRATSARISRTRARPER